jgi:pheromone shutdown protein TraB
MSDQFDTRLALTILVLATFALIIVSAATMSATLHRHLIVVFGCWFVINGALSGLGAIIARGHPYSVLTAFSIAWLTSMHPILAAGWFAGAVEVVMRKPSLQDIPDIAGVKTLSQLMDNNLFRVILVVALANLGSVAGTFIGTGVLFQIGGIDALEMLGVI